MVDQPLLHSYDQRREEKRREGKVKKGKGREGKDGIAISK